MKGKSGNAWLFHVNEKTWEQAFKLVKKRRGGRRRKKTGAGLLATTECGRPAGKAMPVVDLCDSYESYEDLSALSQCGMRRAANLEGWFPSFGSSTEGRRFSGILKERRHSFSPNHKIIIGE